jgi:hypothetical protein
VAISNGWMSVWIFVCTGVSVLCFAHCWGGILTGIWIPTLKTLNQSKSGLIDVGCTTISSSTAAGSRFGTALNICRSRAMTWRACAIAASGRLAETFNTTDGASSVRAALCNFRG